MWVNGNNDNSLGDCLVQYAFSSIKVVVSLPEPMKCLALDSWFSIGPGMGIILGTKT